MPDEDHSKTIEKELCCALVECKEQYDIPADVLREALTNIPPVLLLPDFEANELLDLNAQASLLRASQGRWDEIENAEWGKLDRKERRSTQKLAAFLDADRLFPKQRPAEIDTRLAVYLIFRFEEILGKKLPFSRPTDGGSARGPAFKAVLYALLLAELRSGKHRTAMRPDWRASLRLREPRSLMILCACKDLSERQPAPSKMAGHWL